MILKLKGEQLNFSTANTVNDSVLVRLHASASTLITITDSEDDVVGSFTMPANTVDFIEKSASDTITANVAIDATPVSYRT